MSKRLRVIGNERLDLEDFLHGGSGFAAAEIRLHVQQLVSELMGVVEGFDVALDGPPGTATNVIRIYNGTALDPTLQLVHLEDAPGSVVTLALEGAGLHHVGILFRLVPSDTAARSFWDPVAQNPDGSVGREFTQEVRTRLAATFEPVDALDDPTFASSGVSTPALVVPLCVVPVVTRAGRSVIDEGRLRTEPTVGKVLTLDTSDPARTRIQVVSAKRFRTGSALSVPASPNAYSIDTVDPVKNELVITPPLPPVDQARAVAIGFVTNHAAALPPASWGYRFIRSVGRLADLQIPGDSSAPGDVRPRLFEGDVLRGEKLLARPADVPDRLGELGERLTGRDEEALGTQRSLRDALAFVLAEAKFGRPGTWARSQAAEAVPRWIDPVPVPLWDIARLYFNELNGTGVISGGRPTQVELAPGAAPGQFTARVHLPETHYYSAGIRHRMAAVVDTADFTITPAAGVLFAYYWATPQPNTDSPGLPLTGPDWQTSPTRVHRTESPDFRADPPPPTTRSVLLGGVRFDNRAGGTLPTPTVIAMARVPRRVPDLLAPDAQGHLQRDLVFRSWALFGDRGRRITVDDPRGQLHLDVGAGTLLVHSRGIVHLLADQGGPAAAIQAHQSDPSSPVIVQVSPAGLDLTAASALRLWEQGIGGRGNLRAVFGVAADRGGGLRDHGAVASLEGVSGDATLAGALRLAASDGFDQGGWSDGTVLVDAEVLEIRRRLRLLGQATMINVDRDASGNASGAAQGFNFVNPYKVPLAWAYLTYQPGGSFLLRAQSHYQNANGGLAQPRRAPVWLPPFAPPVDPTPPLVEVVGPSSSTGAVYGFQLPFAPWFRPTAPRDYIVTLQVNPRYEAWRGSTMLGPRPRRPYDQLASFCTASDVAWLGFGRDLRFDNGTVLSAANGPLLVYSYPAAYLSGLEGVLVQVWGVLGQGTASGDPSSPADTFLRSV